MEKYTEETDYTVIIGDIVGSKGLTNRKQVQSGFRQILEEMNSKYAKDIASKFTITLGDEFQGLLKRSDHAIRIILEIEKAMNPVKMRFGVGIGEISTAINFEQSSEIDGPAYHRARAMGEYLEANENQHFRPAGNILISSKEENKEIDQLINSLLSVTSVLKLNWTSKQKEIIKNYHLAEENQSKAAERLGIGQSSVSRALSNANYATYQSAMNTIHSFLARKEAN